MTSGKYFNRNVCALDDLNVGYVAKETKHQIVVFGEKNKRYDIPVEKIKMVSKNVLVDMKIYQIEKNYEIERNAPLPSSITEGSPQWHGITNAKLATYEGKYPNSLFNKGVRAKNEDHIGHVFKETGDKIIVFGDENTRYDIPKSKILAVDMNVIIDMDFPLLIMYKMDKNTSLPQ
ncbi:MAG: hypothetical protein ACPKPY_12880 [Nitrososphaeraceae archaeon]